MKNLILSALFIIFCLFCKPCFAQQSNTIDSLEHVLKAASEDTNKVNTLIALSAQFKSNDPDTAIYFGNQALTLATKLNYKPGMADANWRMGQANVNLGKYEEALKNSNDAFALYDQLIASEKTSDTTALLKKKSGIYNLLGQIYYLQGKYAEALKVNTEALKIRKEVGDKFGYSASLVSVGNIYYAQGDLDNALTSYEAALKIREELGEKSGIADCYSNIGIIYWEQEKDSLAIKNYLASLNIKKEIGDKKGIATTYNNLGSLYFAVANYDEALKNYFLSLTIRNEINDMMGVATTCNNIGNIYTKQKKYKDASVYLNKSIALSNEIGSLEDIKEGYQNLAVLDSAQGNYKQAFEHHKLYIAFRDSLVNEDNIKKMADAQLQYELDKRESLAKAEQEKKDALYLKEMQKQKLLRNGIIIGAAFLILLTILFFNRYQLRKKLEKQQAINSERHRISADLHDDIGSGLSKISLLSELIKRESQKPEVLAGSEKISDTLKGLSGNLSEIIWALNSNNDYLENLIAYIRRYAAEYFEDSKVALKIKTPDNIPDVAVTSEQRRNIFFVVKEALHNIIKHADATEAELNFIIRDNKLIVTIHDNGKGFHSGEPNRFGNGIKNMHSRMTSINGTFAMENNNGTKAVLEFPV